MASMEEKMDALLNSVQSLRQAQAESQEEVARKLAQLETDVARNQEGTAQRLLKRLKRDRQPEFKRKGHERQFRLLDGIKDRVEAASELLDSLKPERPEEAATVKAAQEELAEGIREITGQQKLIRIADRSELGWKVVEAYESDELASGDEDAKRIEKAEKTAEQRFEKKKRKMAQKSARGRGFRRGTSQYTRDTTPQPGTSRSFLPSPSAVTPQFARRTPGPCFNCLEMGHLRSDCPKLRKT